MKVLTSRSLVFTLSLAIMVSFVFVSCSENPTVEEETEEDGVEIYEPMLGKWQSVKGPHFKEYRKVNDNTGTLYSYSLDHTGFCENNYEYAFQTKIKWTMWDTSLPIKTIRYDHIRRASCGEIFEDNKPTVLVRDGFEIRGDTLYNGASKFFRVEE